MSAALEKQKAGEASAARELYEQALTLDSGNADALHMLGVLAYQEGDWATAERHILDAKANSPVEVPMMESNLRLVRFARDFSGEMARKSREYIEDAQSNDSESASGRPRLTFCVGAPRSGTTLVSSLLSEGEAAYPMLPECSFITTLIRHYFEILHHSDKPRFEAYALSEGELAKVFAPSIDGFLRNAVSHFPDCDADNLVLKDPELSSYLDCLPAFFGRFKVVCVVRDPRDVVASLMKVAIKQERKFSVDELISNTYDYYLRVTQSEISKAGHVHYVRYEHIVDKDEAEFSRLEGYLGFTVGRHGFGKTFFDFDRGDATHSDNYGAPIRNIASDHSILGEAGVRKIQEIFLVYNSYYRWW